MFVHQEELTWLGGERLEVQGRRCLSMTCVELTTILIILMCMCIHVCAGTHVCTCMGEQKATPSAVL